MNIGDNIYQVVASVFSKRITEYKIKKINPKTLLLIGENGEQLIKKDAMDSFKEGIIIDSIYQYTDTIEKADILSIQLMDVVIGRKHRKLKDIQNEIDKGIELRNSAPQIRRMQ